MIAAFRMRAGIGVAGWYRSWLRNVQFIAVTGSCGKTTTKELIAAILGSERRGRKTPAYGNVVAVIAKTVLRTTNRDAFCVLEVSAGTPGAVARAARLIRPQIVVVTSIGSDHRKLYRTLEAAAQEKGQLLAGAGPGATAVLNADDPHVIAMADGFAGTVLSFGRSDTAVLRAEDVRAAWPERLSFTLHVAGRSLPVQTRLCGKHWVSSVLAALGAAIAEGMPIERAVAALAQVPPTPGRMSPVARGAVTFIRDEFKAPMWTMDTVFEFLAEARAPRKVAVIGTISDYATSASRVYRTVAERALAVSDQVVFVGPNARHALRARAGADPDSLHAFASVAEAATYLRHSLRQGDLVLLKGSGRADRLLPLVSAATPDGRPDTLGDRQTMTEPAPHAG